MEVLLIRITTTDTLTSLPAEILCRIFPWLDPIALISLSQASSFFRKLIDPQRCHFVRRLLALELLPEYGGVTPIYFPRLNCLLPPHHDTDKWSSIRYACCSCLRLRSHIHFNNRAILGLGLRKPSYGSRAASQLCGWELGDPRTRAIRRRAQLRAEAPELARWRKIYAKIAGLQLDDRDNPLRIKGGPLRMEAKERQAELVLCGREREKRMCDECLYARGYYDRRVKVNIGPLETPVVKSRIQNFSDAIDRYFPGLAPEEGPLESTFLARYKTYSRGDLAFDRFPTYMTRCRACSVWQELAAFRVRAPDPRNGNIPLSCDKCLLDGIGAHALGKLLYDFWLGVATDEIAQLHRILKDGWRLVRYNIYQSPGPMVTWESICEQWGSASDSASPNPLNDLTTMSYPQTGSSDPNPLSDAFAVWKNYVEGSLKPKGLWDNPPRTMGICLSNDHPQLQSWTQDHDQLVDRIARLVAWRDQLSKDPSPLVQHALREHARFVGLV